MSDAPRPDQPAPDEPGDDATADRSPQAEEPGADRPVPPDPDPLSAEEVAPDDPAAGAAEREAEDPVDLEAVAQADPRSKGELLAELVGAEHKRDEYLDDLRRSHAEFENYRRRVMREGATQREAGKGEVAGGLLEVLDDLDRTLEAAEGSSDRDLAKGVQLVASKLVRSLGEVGLERIDATEVEFDPNVHEAVQQQPADEDRDEPIVAQVLRPGYRLGDRVLRAAMVIVEQ